MSERVVHVSRWGHQVTLCGIDHFGGSGWVFVSPQVVAMRPDAANCEACLVGLPKARVLDALDTDQGTGDWRGINQVSGAQLDRLGESYALTRNVGEPDAEFRRRLHDIALPMRRNRPPSL